MASKKDYILVAEAISDALASIECYDDSEEFDYKSMRLAIMLTARTIGAFFEKENSRFDIRKFNQAIAKGE